MGLWNAGFRPGMMVIMVLLLLAGMSVAQAQQTRIPGPKVDFRPEIVFAVGEWPPMISETAPEYGEHTRRVSEVFRALGYRVRYEFLPWRRAYEQTVAGDYVATFSWFATPARQEQTLVPRHPMARAMQKAFFRKSRFPHGLDIRNLADIRRQGLRPVGVASYWYEAAYRYHGISADIVSTADAAWRFLNAGRADIFIEEEKVGWHDMAKILGPDAMADYDVTDPLVADDMYVLFSRNHPMGKMLRDDFDAYLDSDGGRAMCRRWGLCDEMASRDLPRSTEPGAFLPAPDAGSSSSSGAPVVPVRPGIGEPGLSGVPPVAPDAVQRDIVPSGDAPIPAN